MLKELFNNVTEPFKSDTLFIVQTYLDAGYECFVVGGPVRDLLLGLAPKDIDLATNCPLEKTEELFENVIPTGESHGTLTVHLNGENYEITRYRTDVSCDGRNATIEFSETFEDDAQRRDLTVNAIGYNPITNELKDPTGGMEDFNNHMLRFVGKAEDRIKEDHLRAIRFIRFMAKMDAYGFTTDRDSLNAVTKVYDHKVVSVERIYQEFDGMFKILKDNDYTKEFVTRTLKYMHIFRRFLGDDKLGLDMVIDEIFTTYDYFPLVKRMNGDSDILRLGHEYKKLYQWFEMFKEKDFSNQVIVKDLLTETKGDFEASERVMRYFKSFNKENNHKDGLITLKALKNKEGTVDAEPFMITQLNVDGKDLMNKGLKGVEVGAALKRMLEAVKVDSSMNTKEQLMEMVF